MWPASFPDQPSESARLRVGVRTRRAPSHRWLENATCCGVALWYACYPGQELVHIIETLEGGRVVASTTAPESDFDRPPKNHHPEDGDHQLYQLFARHAVIVLSSHPDGHLHRTERNSSFTNGSLSLVAVHDSMRPAGPRTQLSTINLLCPADPRRRRHA